jgi:DNA polymerase III subunit beta
MAGASKLASAGSGRVKEARTPFEGEPLEIGFNPEFLREGIESLEGDEIVLRLISPLRPGLLQSPERDFQYLIMPIRLAG